jgi:putative ABC transport system permease protein
MKLFRALDAKLLWRDWRGGELNVLVAALLVAVTTVTGIGLFSSRIQNSILDEAGSLLAADAQITGSKVIPEAWVNSAIESGLETASVLSFQAMAFGPKGGVQLSSVKAVSESYPLKGELEVGTVAFGVGEKTTSVPNPGEAWVNARLLASLSLQMGDVVGVGDADFLISKVLVSEPDESGGFSFGPRVLINEVDVPITGAVQVGSRVRYRLLLAGDVESYYEDWKPQQGDHHRWRSVSDANESVTQTLERADSFLLLAGSLGVILAGVALALASKRYAQRQLSHVALLKTLGLTPNRIGQLYAGNLVIIGLLVVAIGLTLGWFLHWVFLELFSGLLPRELEAASVRPFIVGSVTGLICLIAFALPPVWVLRQTPPSRVLRSDVAGGTTKQWQTTLLGALAVIAIVYFYSSSWIITGALLVAGLIAILGVTLLARWLIILARKGGSRFGTTWRLGLASLQRHGSQNSFQIMIFAMALMLLFLLTLLRTSLLSEWQQQLPEGTPNHFAFNIFENERSGIEQLLADNNVAATPFYPMIRGRLIDIEGESLNDRLDRLKPDGDDFRRELNITWSNELSEDNEVVEGAWFKASDSDQVLISVEQDFADALEVTLGDELQFSFGGQEVTAKVSSLRTVQWDSLSPNFYVIFNSPILNGQGAAYLTSFYLNAEQKPLLVEILNQYSTITVIEVDVILNQIQSIVGQVTLAIEFILALVLVAGLIVLVASVQATLDSRLQESAILRTIGARAKIVQGALAIEFVSLGALAGFLAAAGAEVALFFLQTQLLNMEYQPNWLVFFIGPVVGAVIIGFVGLVSTRKVVKVPPLTVLRQL